jgi:hypothetical protein
VGLGRKTGFLIAKAEGGEAAMREPGGDVQKRAYACDGPRQPDQASATRVSLLSLLLGTVLPAMASLLLFHDYRCFIAPYPRYARYFRHVMLLPRSTRKQIFSTSSPLRPECTTYSGMKYVSAPLSIPILPPSPPPS